MAASCVFDHDSGFLETGDGWSIVTSASGLSNGRILCLRSRQQLHGNGERLVGCDVCLGPLERPHPASSITTAASWKRRMVGRFPKTASGFSKGRILCLRSRQRLHGNGRWLAGFGNLPGASRMAASCVFDYNSSFMETGDGWLASEFCLGPLERSDPASSITTAANSNLRRAKTVDWFHKYCRAIHRLSMASP